MCKCIKVHIYYTDTDYKIKNITKKIYMKLEQTIEMSDITNFNELKTNLLKKKLVFKRTCEVVL